MLRSSLAFVAFVVVAYLARRYQPQQLVAARLSPRWRPFAAGLWTGVRIAGVLLVLASWPLFVAGWEHNGDWLAYYRAARTGDLPYSTPVNVHGAYLYSPAFAHAFKPVALVTNPRQFYAVFAALDLVALLYLAGPIGAPLALAFQIVHLEVTHGNIHLLMAAAVALGLRHPAAWSFVLLTKVSPGLGMLWFVIRREWRSLAVALATTAVIVVVSLPFDPDGWVRWVASLARGGVDSRSAIIPIAREQRWAAAVVLVCIGAWRGVRWSVPVAVMLAVPIFWPATITMLLGIVPLGRRTVRGVDAQAADRWIGLRARARLWRSAWRG
jgi:hypothetical protein